MKHYIALIHKEPNSDFGVSFPDFPGCITAGSTLEEAFHMGAEALAGHIELLAEGGEAIPEPSGMDAVMADPDNRDGVAVLIPAPNLEGKTVRVNITLPERLVERIDAKTDNRSRFLAQAAARALEGA